MRESEKSQEDAQLSHPPQVFLFFLDRPPPTPVADELTNLETMSLPWVADTWWDTVLTVLFILSSARSKDYERAVGNGGTDLERLKQC